jgi:hypothetical protein
MNLSERVLGLHRGIRTVLITTKQVGEWRTTQEALRSGVEFLEDSRDEARSLLALAPAVMLGSAQNIGGKAGNAQIVAVLYEKVGAIFAPMDPAIDHIMCLTTEREALEEVMHTVRKAMPALMVNE